MSNNKDLLGRMSYSGSDINVYVMIPKKIENEAQSDETQVFNNDVTIQWGDSFQNVNTKEKEILPFVKLGELQTISCSIYREKVPVKGLGFDGVRGHSRGYVHVAGTMIFTVFYDSVLNEIVDNEAITGSQFSYKRIDQLPPLNLAIYFGSESGQNSKMFIWGVEFMNEGQVMSIQDLITENSVNYVAQDISRMRPYGKGFESLIPTNRPAKGRIAKGQEADISEQLSQYKRYFL